MADIQQWLRRGVRALRPQTRLFPTRAAAAAAAGAGYLDEAVADVVQAKTREHARRHREPVIDVASSDVYALVAATLSQARPSPSTSVRVLDVGGACGAHYYAVRAGVPPGVPIDWTVVETPVMVDRGRQLAAAEGVAGSLRFATDIASALQQLGGVDVVFSSGALQYMPSPLEALRACLGAAAPTLVLTRLGVSPDSRSYAAVQSTFVHDHGPGAPLERTHQRCRTVLVLEPAEQIEALLRTGYQRVQRVRDTVPAYRVRGLAFPSMTYICQRAG